MPIKPSASTSGQSRSGGSLIQPVATGTTRIAEAIEKRSSDSSAGEKARKPYAMAANALDQITTANEAAASVTASRRSMAESITAASSADLSRNEAGRRDDAAADARSCE